MFKKLVLSFFVCAPLIAMGDKNEVKVVERSKESASSILSQYSINLPFGDLNHVVPLKSALNHMMTCQINSDSSGSKSIAGFHYYGDRTHDAPLPYDKGLLLKFSPSLWVYVPGDTNTLRSIHCGYIIYRGIVFERPKTFFPEHWSPRHIVDYLHSLTVSKIVDISASGMEHHKSFKVQLQAEENDEVSVMLVVKGCPSVLSSMKILTLFPSLRQEKVDLANIRVLADTQSKQLITIEKKVSESDERKGTSLSTSMLLAHELIEDSNTQDFKNIKQYLEGGGDPNRADSHGMTLLMHAAKRAHISLLSYLLENTWSTDRALTDKKGKSALIYAIESGDYTAVILLIHGLVNKANHEKLTPLMAAVQAQYHDIVSILLLHKPECDACDRYGRTALMYAAKIPGKIGTMLVEILLAHGVFADTKDTSGKTALHHAVEAKNENTVALLLQAGVDITITDNHKKHTACHTAVNLHYHNVAKCFERYELEKRAWIEENCANELLFYCQKNCIRGIIRLGIDPVLINHTDNSGRIPLLYALQNAHMSIAELLIRNGADPNLIAINEQVADADLQAFLELYADKSPLSKAHLEKIIAIRACQSSEKSEQDSSETALLEEKKAFIKAFSADSAGGMLSADTCQKMIPFINLKNKNGETPLLLAVKRNKHTIVQQILDCPQANTNIKDNSGNCVLALAYAHADEAMIELLCSHKVELLSHQSVFSVSDRIIVEFIESVLVPIMQENVSSDHMISALRLIARLRRSSVLTSFLKMMVRDKGHMLVPLLDTAVITLDEHEAYSLILEALAQDKVALFKDLLMRFPMLLNRKDDAGITLLMRAAKKNDQALVSLLIERGADSTALDNAGKSAIDYAHYKSEVSSYLYAINRHKSDVLVREREDVRKREEQAKLVDNKYSPLMIAAYFDDTQAIERIAQRISNDDCSTASPSAVLQVACEGDPLLTEHVDGLTALMVAIEKRHHHALSKIITLFPQSIDQANKQGVTPLMVALQHLQHNHEYVTIVNMLLDARVSVLVIDNHGNNVFHYMKGKKNGMYGRIVKIVKDQILQFVKSLTSVDRECALESLRALKPLIVSFGNELRIDFYCAIALTGRIELSDEFLALINYASEGKGALDFDIFSFAVKNNLLDLFKRIIVERKITAAMFDICLQHNEFIAHTSLLEAKIDIPVEEHLLYLKKILAKNDFELLRLFVERCQIDTNAILHKGVRVPLVSLLCSQENEPCVALLLQLGVNVNYVDKHGRTALHTVCSQKQPSKVKLLLAANALVNVKDEDGNTPLMLAIKAGCAESLRLLLAAQADPAIVNRAHETCYELMLKANKDVQQTLFHALKLKASEYRSKLNTDAVATFDETQMQAHAELTKNKSLLIELIENLADKGRFSTVAEVKKRCNQKNRFGESLLIQACLLGCERAVFKLLEIGADIHSTDSEGNTALHHACILGHGEIVDLLLRDSAQIQVKNSKGQTPFMCAVQSRVPLVIIDRLVKAGALLDGRDATLGQSAFDYCFSAPFNREVAQYLIDSGYDINQLIPRQGAPLLLMTLFQTACMGGDIESDKIRDLVLEGTRFLLAQPSLDINKITSDGDTALHFAILYNYIEISKCILACPALAINAQNKLGRTVLMIALLEGREEILEMLIKRRDVDFSVKDKKGFSALQYACDPSAPTTEKCLLMLLSDDRCHMERQEGILTARYARKKGWNAALRLLVGKGFRA